MAIVGIDIAEGDAAVGCDDEGRGNREAPVITGILFRQIIAESDIDFLQPVGQFEGDSKLSATDEPRSLRTSNESSFFSVVVNASSGACGEIAISDAPSSFTLGSAA